VERVCPFSEANPLKGNNRKSPSTKPQHNPGLPLKPLPQSITLTPSLLSVILASDSTEIQR